MPLAPGVLAGTNSPRSGEYHPFPHIHQLLNGDHRANIQRSSRRLRSVISAPEFVRYFGEPHPLEDGGRQNVFGMDDELKVAPKGVDKGHKYVSLFLPSDRVKC